MQVLQPVLLFLLILQTLSCIIWVRNFAAWKHSSLQLFPFYLCFIVGAETVGWILDLKSEFALAANFFKYLVIPVEYCFLLFLFYREWVHWKYRYVVLLFISLYLVSFMAETYLGWTRHLRFFSLSYTLGNLFLLITVLAFLLRLGSGKGILFIRHNPLFWMSCGMLVFYIGSFPFYGLYLFLGKTNLILFYRYQFIVTLLNCFMYTLFLIAGLWGKPKYISSFSSLH